MPPAVQDELVQSWQFQTDKVECERLPFGIWRLAFRVWLADLSWEVDYCGKDLSTSWDGLIRQPKTWMEFVKATDWSEILK